MASADQTGARRDGLLLMAIGDVHLGTRAARVPADLADWGVDPRELTPEAALGAAIDRAIVERVDAVLFAGDLVESTNARFEAIRPLETAVHRLADAGIPVVAVAGNHDVEALPRLAGVLETLSILGRHGRWESRLIGERNRLAVEIVGWSFPEREVRSSPLAALLRAPLPPRHPELPRLGLLHGDMDAAGGPYAPFTRSELDAAGLDAWLLGHIHRPSLAGGVSPEDHIPCGYLGSLVGLDPTETGNHGPWLVHVEPTRRVTVEHLQLAPLRWETLDVRLEENDGPEDLADRLMDEAERLAREIRARGATPRALGLRVRVHGVTRHYDALRQRIDSRGCNEIHRAVGETIVFVDKVTDDLTLVVDLDEIAHGDDPPGLLARKLIALERGGDDARALIETTRRRLRTVTDDSRWAPLQQARHATDILSDDAVRAVLEQAGTAVLNALLSQREAGQGGERS